MKFSIKNSNLEKERSSCIIIGIFETCRLSQIAEQFDRISNGYISSLLQREKLDGQLGQALLLHYIPNILFERILIIGCGKEKKLNLHRYQFIFKKIVNILNNTGSVDAICCLTQLHIKNLNIYWKVRHAVETIQEALYSFEELKTNKIKPRCLLHKIVFYVPNHDALNHGNLAIQHGLAIAEGITEAKNLGNLPPNICNTIYLADKAKQLTNVFKKNMIVSIINQEKMRKLGMNAYLSVGCGSKNASLMSVIQYKSDTAKNIRPIVLIGKGLTFDSGGISIKPSIGMDEMKYDMCGAGAVYGVMQTIAKLKLPLHVIGILAGCENMISSHSYRPGDILTTMSGQTVEVLNTDAEGRLVLCDVLTYVERFKPIAVIDVATLTGACVIALGHHITGLMSNHNPLARELIIASKQSGDLAWCLPPLDEQFQNQLESNFADIANVGGRPGSAITAGCFLSRFTNKYHWVHLDIAGTAWNTGKKKSATGRPVAMLSQFLLNRSGFKKTYLTTIF